jgi:hypothetical protein
MDWNSPLRLVSAMGHRFLDVKLDASTPSSCEAISPVGLDIMDTSEIISTVDDDYDTLVVTCNDRLC